MTVGQGFLSYDIARRSIPDGARVAVLGIPEGPQAEQAESSCVPDVFRRVSRSLDLSMARPGTDLGNTDFSVDWADTMGRVAAGAEAAQAVPVFLGGGPRVAEAAFSLWPDQCVIAVSHILTDALHDREVLWLGLNGPQPASLWGAVERGQQSGLTARAIDAGAHPVWPESAVLWLDAAVFDTGHAAGASEVNPGGATPDALVDLMAEWTGQAAGIVVSGAAPERDPRGLTELALVRIIAGVLGNG